MKKIIGIIYIITFILSVLLGSLIFYLFLTYAPHYDVYYANWFEMIMLLINVVIGISISIFLGGFIVKNFQQKKNVLNILLLIAPFLIIGVVNEMTKWRPYETTVIPEISLTAPKHLEEFYETLVVLIETEDTYGCANYGIETSELIQEKNIFRISLEKIVESEGCLTALGPASATIKLPDLILNTDYVLEVERNGQYEKYIIEYRDETNIKRFN